MTDLATRLPDILRDQVAPDRALKTNLLDAAFEPYPGIPRGSLIVLTAGPKAGKTTLAAEVAHRVVRLNARSRVLFYTAELPEWLLVAKLLASTARTDLSAIIAGAAVGEPLPEVCRRALREMADDGGERFRFLRGPAHVSALDRQVREFGPDLVVVDYLQRLLSDRPGAGRREEVDGVLTHLTGIKMRDDTAILAISSESRGAGGDPYGRGRGLGSAKESGDIEYEADYVWRMQLTREHHERERRGDVLGEVDVELRCLASRLTEPRDLLLRFDRNRQSFSPGVRP